MSSATVVAVVSALAAVAAAFGLKEALAHWVARRGERLQSSIDRREDRVDAAALEQGRVSAVSAQGNLDVLKVLLEETKSRVDGYERAIAELKASHTADIREIKTENRALERQVADLRLSLQEYQLGNRVPRGMVLVPVREIRQIRERHAGVLEQRWYPGEMEGGDDAGPNLGPSITAQITRLDGPRGGGG